MANESQAYNKTYNAAQTPMVKKDDTFRVITEHRDLEEPRQPGPGNQGHRL